MERARQVIGAFLNIVDWLLLMVPGKGGEIRVPLPGPWSFISKYKNAPAPFQGSPRHQFVSFFIRLFSTTVPARRLPGCVCN